MAKKKKAKKTSAKKTAKRGKVSKKTKTKASKSSKTKASKKKAAHGQHPNSRAALDASGPRKGDPSRNPTGRPIGRSLTVMLRKIVDASDPGSTQTNGEKILDTAVKMARAGNFSFFKEIFERLDGKVPDRVLNEMTKRFVDEEVSTFAASMIGVVLEVAGEFIPDADQLESFTDQLQSGIDALTAASDDPLDLEPII